MENLQTYSYLKYKENDLQLYGNPIEKIIGGYNTPFFIFLQERFKENYTDFKKALDKHVPNHFISYAVKANYLGKVLETAKELHMGLEVMSYFEMLLAKKSHFEYGDLIFNGPSKTMEELTYAIKNEVGSINVESINEIKEIEKLCQNFNLKRDVTIRIHPKLSKKLENKLLIKKNSKLGIDYKRAKKLYKYIERSAYLNAKGVHVHLGTNLTSHEFYDELLSFLNEYVRELQNEGILLDDINLGGGLASKSFLDRTDFSLDKLSEQISTKIDNIDDKKILFELGRYMVADSFITITKVLRTKKSWGRKWAFIDVGANILIPMRYTIYEAFPVKYKGEGHYCNIGGPLCLPVDVLSNDAVKFKINEQDNLVIVNSGAYTLSMSEQFGYPRPTIYQLNGVKLELIKAKDTYQEMVESAFGRIT